MYIYIYRERERERKREMATHTIIYSTIINDNTKQQHYINT